MCVCGRSSADRLSSINIETQEASGRVMVVTLSRHVGDLVHFKLACCKFILHNNNVKTDHHVMF